jgi:molybdenum-dependent DNA-binding transcriptional regulator ModE
LGVEALADRIRCRICGAHFQSLTWSHLRKHGTTPKMYKERFGVEFVTADACRVGMSKRQRRDGAVSDYRPRTKKQILDDLRGSWENAVRLAGLDYARIRRGRLWTEESVAEALQRWSSEQGPLVAARLRETDPTLLAAVLRFYNSLQMAARRLGLPYRRLTRKRTIESVARDLRAWNRRHGPLNRSMMKSTAPKLLSAVERKFGSVAKAADELGLQHVSMVRQWTTESVLAAIRVLKEDAKPLHSAAVQRADSGMLAAGIKLFGSWNAALETAGLDPVQIMKRKVRKTASVAAELRDWCVRHGTLNSTALRQDDPALHLAASRRFGGIEKAAKTLGLPYIARRR